MRLALLTFSIVTLASAQVNVLNVNYDTHQTGANLKETTLTPGMNWQSFGKVGTFPVDGAVYAQPLYVAGVAIGGATYNVLYVATMHNSVYAFNADAPQSATPLWQVNLGASIPAGLFNFTDILPEIGILGTPAIDAKNQIMYVVADMLPAGAFSTPNFQLHALSLIDGHEMFDGPVDIKATVSGTGANSSNGTITFDGFLQLQRPGLMLANRYLYIGFGSHADAGNYQGWMLAYHASTLERSGIFNVAPNGRQGAIWQAGRAPAIDSLGNVLVATGNGDWDGVDNFGESLLHLSGSNLSLLDWYTPQEWSTLNQHDWDLGSAGAILIPGVHYLVTAGKAGMLYLVNYDSLGHLGPDNTGTVQGVQVNGAGLFDMALWSAAPNGPMIYEYDVFNALKAFQITNNQLNSTILSQFTPVNASVYAGVAVSANGNKNGIVWLVTGNKSVAGTPATLYALDATNLANMFWSSDTNATRDAPGGFTKFTPPTVVNGSVYVPTVSNAVAVYGTIGNSQVEGTPAISAVVNSASFLMGGISPGELITIFGANLGPDVDSPGHVNGNVVGNMLNNLQVLIGGTPAPILYASPTQINVVVPFGLSGASAQIEIVSLGQSVISTTVPVQAASPALFSANSNGGGPGAILNQDGSINTRSNPAAPGSVVSLFATGGGLTTPVSVDGALTAKPYPAPNLPVSVTINGEKAKVIYAGAAPGLVAGVMQINVIVPADTPAVSYNQIVVTVGDYSSPTAVTLPVN
ncbi:MAG TPA: IPT/TIG domain-containing protein [Bryobacteraceae bacterium]|nr:IPT/TIG domain-containing protein [Bryobacteraceae bacterium]